MKSLGRTIDRILRIAPELKPQLSMIKSKWKRWPQRTTDYWKELATTLSQNVADEEEQEKIREILYNPRRAKPIYTFDEVGPNDKVLGTIPEYLADRIKRHDLASVHMAMQQTKASLTKDPDLIVQLTRRSAKTEIAMKKIWLDLKDHFGLWDKNIKVTIKKQGSLLQLVIDEMTGILPSKIPGVGDSDLMIKVDPDTLRGIFRMLGLDPPLGL